jgi:hypothetical protein
MANYIINNFIIVCATSKILVTCDKEEDSKQFLLRLEFDDNHGILVNDWTDDDMISAVAERLGVGISKVSIW